MRWLLLAGLSALEGCCLENSCRPPPPPPCGQYEETSIGPLIATPDGGAVVLTVHTSDKTPTAAWLRKLDATGAVVWQVQLGASFTNLTGGQKLAVLTDGSIVVWVGGWLGGFDAGGRAQWDAAAPSAETPTVFAPLGAQVVQVAGYTGQGWHAYQVQPGGAITNDTMLPLQHDDYEVDLSLTSDGGYLLATSGGLERYDGKGAFQWWTRNIAATNYAVFAREVADGYVVLASITGNGGLIALKVTKDGSSTAELFRDDSFLGGPLYAVQSDSVAASLFKGVTAYNLDGSRRFLDTLDVAPYEFGPAAAGGYVFTGPGAGDERCHRVGALESLRGDGTTAWQISLEP